MNIVWAISVDNWYVLYQDREKWPNMCAVAVDEVAQCMEKKYLCCQQGIPGKLFFVIVEDILEDKQKGHQYFCDVFSLSLA